jgi:hypothetical protein
MWIRFGMGGREGRFVVASGPGWVKVTSLIRRVLLLCTVIALGVLAEACEASRPERVLLSRGGVVPPALARRSRLELSDYYARTASVVESGTSISILARIVDRSYVHSAVRERARAGRWAAERARRDLGQAEAYYLAGRLSFEVEVAAGLGSGLATRRFSDVAAWQWTLSVDGGEPLVASDAVTTWRRAWRQESGGGYLQGRTFVPDPVFVIERHALRGVVRFGPPAPVPRRVVTLRAYPPGLPAVLSIRWRVARESARGA